MSDRHGRCDGKRNPFIEHDATDKKDNEDKIDDSDLRRNLSQ